MDVTPNGGGENDERSVLERTLESDRLYVMDRGYAKFALFNRIVKAESSRKQDGIEIQTYCAIIACLLISLWTGRKPTIRTYEMICFYFLGLASEDELMRHVDKLKRRDKEAAANT